MLVSQHRMESSLEVEYTLVKNRFDDAARRFGEDPSKVPSGEFFALLRVRLFCLLFVFSSCPSVLNVCCPFASSLV